MQNPFLSILSQEKELHQIAQHIEKNQLKHDQKYNILLVASSLVFLVVESYFQEYNFLCSIIAISLIILTNCIIHFLTKHN